MMKASAHNGSGMPPIKMTIGTPAWRARRATSRYLGRTVSSTLALSAASAAALLVASQVRLGSPWMGLNMIAEAAGVGAVRARKRPRFDAGATLAGAGVVALGLFAIAAAFEGIRAARTRR
jgi:hypothetical protein